MRKYFSSFLVLIAIGIAFVFEPLAFGQIGICPVTTQVPTGNPVATLLFDASINECYAAYGDQSYPCCPAAASIDLPAGSYIVTLSGEVWSTEGYGGPAGLPIAWGSGSCPSHSSANCCILIDPRDPRGGPILIDHPGGPVYVWRNDNYWGDNYGLCTISFYAANTPLKITEPSDDVYYLDQTQYTEANVPLKAELLPLSVNNPEITWTLTLRTRVGWETRDITLPNVVTHQDDTDSHTLILDRGGNLEIHASAIADDGSTVQADKVVKIRGLYIASTGVAGTFMPLSDIVSAFDSDLQRAVCWRESEFQQFANDWDEGTPYVSYNVSPGSFDIGLMQINSDAWANNSPVLIERYGWNWQENVARGKRVLAYWHQQAVKWRNDNHLQQIMSPVQVWNDALCRYNTGRQLFVLVNGQLQYNPHPTVQNYGLPYVTAVRQFEETRPWLQ